MLARASQRMEPALSAAAAGGRVLASLGAVHLAAVALACGGAACGVEGAFGGACGLAPATYAVAALTALAALLLAAAACSAALHASGWGHRSTRVLICALMAAAWVAVAGAVSARQGARQGAPLAPRAALMVGLALAAAWMASLARAAHIDAAADEPATLAAYARALLGAAVGAAQAGGERDVEAGGGRGRLVGAARARVAPAPPTVASLPPAAPLPLAKPPPTEPARPTFVMGDDEKSETNKFYCPICMLYYKETLRTACCANYLCEGCAVSFINGKAVTGLETQPAKLAISCPYCNKFQMRLIRVKPTEEARRYEDSPATVRLRNKGSKRVSAPSPLRVGADWDAMGAKMVAFGEGADAAQATGTGNAEAERVPSIDATPRASVDGGVQLFGDEVTVLEHLHSVERARGAIATAERVMRPVPTIVVGTGADAAPVVARRDSMGGDDMLVTPARQGGWRPPRPPPSRATPAMAPGAQALATPYSLVPGAAPTGAQGQEQGQAPDDGVSPGPTHLPWEERQAQGQAHVRAGVARRLDGSLSPEPR